MVIVRLAGQEDVDQLVRMRWEFSEEDKQSGARYEEFHTVCSSFLTRAIGGGDWHRDS
ncbi:hypothetical protein [Paenibacillus sp. 1011MAR3C5]|uniref:hypothetical protein n=1 Tax=Paenibacillus sp. 1011MAR3C5 TaxID=1675787 RepID=UPI002175D632|nr:hypothetical protein [Paenibacillus sp. 1011MAR3C5]